MIRLSFDGTVLGYYGSMKEAQDVVASVLDGAKNLVPGERVEIRTDQAHIRFLPEYNQNWTDKFVFEDGLNSISGPWPDAVTYVDER